MTFFIFTTTLEILPGLWFTSSYSKGSYQRDCLCVKLFCECGHNYYWSSQRKVKDTFMGNILTVASIILGGTYIQFNSVSNILKLQFLSFTQFYALQKKYIFPAINKIYKIYRNHLLDESKARETVEVSGDDRCNTPIYNAKYCTYSITS